MFVGGIKQPRIRIQYSQPKKGDKPPIVFNIVRGYLPPGMSRVDAAKMEATEEAETYGKVKEIELPPQVWNTGTHSIRGKKGFTYASCEWNLKSLIKVNDHYVPNLDSPLVKKALGDSHEKISSGLEFYPWQTIIEGKVPECSKFANDGITLVGILYLIKDLLGKKKIVINF